MSLAGTPCYWIPSVACPGSTSAWRASSFSLRRDPCCGPGWASVPVIRSGNTGKSRFLGASLAVAVPIPFQVSRRSFPSGGALLQLRSNRGRDVPSQGCAESERTRGGALSWRHDSKARSRVETPGGHCPRALFRGSHGAKAAGDPVGREAGERTPSRGLSEGQVRDEPDWNRIGVQLICLSWV